MASFRPQAGESVGRSVARLLGTPISAAAHSVAGLKARAGQSLGLLGLSIALLLGGVAAGMLLSTRWQSQPAGSIAPDSPITRQSEREIVASTIGRLESEQAGLKKQISDLRQELNDLQSTDAQRRTTMQDTNKDLERLRIASGMLALHGPGLSITLNDSTANPVPPSEDPARYIIHDYDLRDVVNTLWAAGAEALSVNGERIVGNTSIYCVGTTVIVNATRLSPPYEIRAIGNSAGLEAALRGSTQMEKLNQRAEIYDLPINIEQQKDVYVPGYNGSFTFKQAHAEK
jgi:uncharacterized protein YlxW (UPF0749 family)